MMKRYGDDLMDFGGADEHYRGFDPRDEEAARGPLILALAAGVLVVFGAVVYNTYRQGIRSDTGTLAVIAADDAPYKRRPDDVGGQTVPDQDRRIYDELDGSTRAPAGAELAGAAGASGLRRSVSAGADGPMDIRPAPVEPPSTDIAETAVREAIAMGVAPLLPEDGPDIVALDENTAALAALQPSRSSAFLDTVPAPAPVASRFRFDPRGAYLVQIAALRESDRAERTWDVLASRHPELFDGSQKVIQRADLGARGIFYRVRVGAFADREAAAAFCEALKSTGNDCIIVQ